MELFDQALIVRRECPEIFVHGTRYIELLDGNLVRMWLCEDEPEDHTGRRKLSVPIVKILTPLDHYAWNVRAHIEWAFDRGLLGRPGRGPIQLRPKHAVLM